MMRWKRSRSVAVARRAFGPVVLLAVVSLSLAALGTAATDGPDASAKRMEALTEDVTQGALRVVKEDGGVVECPLKHTDVKAEISGFVARVKVTQTFYNPLDEKIEAVYVFPLPHKAAVDDMTMVIGRRRIVGVIKRRAAARQIYEQALAQGLTAALLEQERPNIFTQSVGNIEPGEEIHIEISYLDVLEYDMGTYEFHFPMVVGPRYIPGKPTSAIPPVPAELQGKVGELDKTKIPEGLDAPKGTGWAPDTDRVPDASRITPPVLKPGYRTGHDISLSVALDAGVPIQNLKVANHKAEVRREGESEAWAKLSPADAVPNKDFVLKYDVVGEKPGMAMLSHTDPSGYGYFMLMIQPKQDERLKQTPPREISFLIDVSGSMRGQPTAKVKETMEKFLKRCKPDDTLQVVTFAGRAAKLFERAVPVTEENVRTALDFTSQIQGSGGTEMLKGVKMVINEPLDPERVRIVIMLTDGFIGNEAEIIAEVGRRCGDRIRFWCIGVGSSPNRFLIDGVARQGGGMSKVLGLTDDPEEMVQEVMFRIHRAQLANISIDWGDLLVSETFPSRIGELWAGRPVILFGRYDPGGWRGVINIKGEIEGEPASWPLSVELPGEAPEHVVLQKVWARQKIEDLMHQTYYQVSPEVEEAVTQIALDYGLMSQYTSFVAVDESKLGSIEEPARPPRRMLVPVPLPEGTSYEGFFGREGESVMYFDGHVKWEEMNYASARNGGAGRRFGTMKALSGPATIGGRYDWRVQPQGTASLRENMAFAAPSRPRGLAGPSVRLGFAAKLRDEERLRATGYAWNALRSQHDLLRKRLAEVLKEAEDLRKEEQLLKARDRFALACFLDTILASMGSSNGAQGAKALEAIEEINKELLGLWAKEIPGLERKLGVVIRDRPVDEALGMTARAGGMKIDLVPGSVQDVCGLLQQKDARVTYLDLRRATVAQALDWILHPLRMSWWVEGGKVVAGTARRCGVAESAWVYDVALIAFPSVDELNKIEDHQKRIEAMQEAVDGFLTAAREGLTLDENSALWFAPGQTLVFGDARTHAAAAKLLADLADPGAKLKGKLAELHAITCKRAAERKDAFEKLTAARAEARIIRSLDTHSWRLLAGAAAGRLDIEAMTELQVAWRQPELQKILEGPGAWVALRSAWAVSESRRAMPMEREPSELHLLEVSIAQVSREAASRSLAALRESPDDPEAFLRLLYATLASGEKSGFRSVAAPLLTKKRPAESKAYVLSVVAQALLAPREKMDPEALIELVSAREGGIAGDDLVVLTALACRRAGGKVWTAFRAESGEILGRQPLSGSVVILVNGLARSRLPLVAARRK